MVKGEEAKSTDAKALFSGKATGLSFDKFDEKVLSWGRKKFGEKYAKALWRNELVDLKKLDKPSALSKKIADSRGLLSLSAIAMVGLGIGVFALVVWAVLG